MANESIRIRTTPGESKNIRFKIEQDFDFLQVLSLRISQEDLYQTFCSNYGVIVGRVIANRGFGVPNAKLSVFVPITSEDEKNLILKDFYPYKTPFDKNAEGIRYNLLLSKTTCELNTPVGTFPTKEEMLDDDLILEVFDKYYKYTTKTNDSGDFMIFGVPVGSHTVHMDVDFSDAGKASIRPYDLIADGHDENTFESNTRFKTSTNLDSLPQIKTGNIAVDVIPFWGNPETCEIGITRTDFDTGFEIKTSSLFFGSIFTDSGKMALNKGCNPKNDMGEQDNLTTGPGLIKMIRVTGYETLDWVTNGDINPTGLEKFDIRGGELIDSDGVFAFSVPLNLGHVITDEFGNTVPSPDPTVGVATKGMYRFAMKFKQANVNAKTRTATILFPSLGPDFGGTIGMVSPQGQGSLADANGTEDQRFTDDLREYDTTVYPNSRIKLDFHTFEWKQVYTIAHYIKKYKKGGNRFSFVGIKNTDITGVNNLFPYNNAIWKFDILYYLSAFGIDIYALFIRYLIIVIGFCIKFCVKLTFYYSRFFNLFTIAGTDYGFQLTIGPFDLIDICFQICPFGFLGNLIGGSFELGCESAPNGEGYEIPPGGNWTICNPNSCNTGNGGLSTTFCRCAGCSGNDFNLVNQSFGIGTFGFGITTSGVSNNTNNPCINLLFDWKCCAKYNIAQNRNVIRRVFNDAWVFGTAYLFKFKYKKKIKKKTGLLRKEKFCGPGADHRRGDNYVSNQCCLDTDGGDNCDKCLLRGPGETKTGINQFLDYHDVKHNYATQNGKTGAADLDDIIYCNALMSTKIVSLGRVEMCLETLEEIENASLANLGIKKYAQMPQFYTGTFFENGWDANFWVDYLKDSSYEDPEDVIIYLAKKFVYPPCNLRELFWGGGTFNGYPCHEFELKDEPFFFVKEISKIYTDIQLTDVFPNEDEFGGFGYGGYTNPYADFNEPPTYGGFTVDLESANRFSPCGGGQNTPCNGLPNPNWINNNPLADPDDATSDSWDRIITRGERNNKNSRSNIPYYYFGVKPGATALSRIRRDYFS